MMGVALPRDVYPVEPLGFSMDVLNNQTRGLSDRKLTCMTRGARHDALWASAAPLDVYPHEDDGCAS
jgi:hypothetical protein